MIVFVLVFKIAAALGALAAAWFWFKASKVKGIEKGIVAEAAPHQEMAKLNSRAALSAGSSALFQAVLIFIS